MKKRFSDLIDMFFPLREKKQQGFRIDDLVVFTLSRKTVEDYCDQFGGDIHLGYSMTDPTLSLQVVDMEKVRVGVNIIKQAKKHRDMSILSGYTTSTSYRDIKNVESNFTNLKWSENENN